MSADFRGILPAVVTPFDENEEFVPRAFELLLERLYSAGVHGLYVCGQTGEGLLLPVAARRSVAEVALRNSPRDKTVIVHVGAHRTADAIELARHASRAGAHAVSSLPPPGAYSFEEIRSYYAALAAASDVPLLVYYFPGLCPALACLDSLRELLALPNVIGLKFTDFDLYRLSLLKQSGACVLNGRDEVLAAGLLMGADGGIGSFYNLVPELLVGVYDSARADNWTQARRLQARINELIEIALRFPMLAAIKTMLSWSGIPCGPCLRPKRPLTAREEDSLRALLASSSFADAVFAGQRI